MLGGATGCNGVSRWLATGSTPRYLGGLEVCVLRLGAVLLLLATACDTSSSEGWVAFNADDETLEIRVTVEAAVDDVATRVLTSTTGAVEVGDVTVDPAAGPVGTDHEVVVVVADEYEEQVERVTVETRGDRGEQTHVLIQDSADHGLWVVQVTSLGEEGETRTDMFTTRLWRAAAEGEEPDTDAGDAE